ncbi:hypothetical protein [Umezakia ovalisporum]|jgi:hypothetical protein|uniref:Uncharacterized protein n=2 Tax=Umezakia ovalisporum TaxID=75695 RepID=A0AA43GXM6_9CYAN|nr:hypothetical protein [Umezakia ovalisporum]MBI1242817.1 hypothetical protein [Nostoc sp. RI_552]MDH6058676.1 hypothetical protein [Umezakia ovalisporum FSS-43]MDH6063666.1 hypothetical protein [Umezakia ovalisporum FSS-62]MDH6067232.1 hypothetical protein [Umezakia ovalisporum APH033B]MDH6070735.1 hypothetical protein [Umezakia ovalisporum CobakiLakeA]
MRNGDQNLVILTIYIIGISYVFNRMVESIDNKVKFEFKKAVVEEQLKTQNLQDEIGISFKFQSSYPVDDLKYLSLSIENKSKDIAIYVDWDNSSLVVEHSKQSRRVIRKSPDLTRDLAVPQSPSLIAPQKTLSETVTAEDVLERDQTSGTYSATKPIINISGLSKGQKKLYNDFMNGRKELQFSLQLVLRISEVRVGLAPGVNIPPMCIINCPFTIKKLPWTYALPWNKK